MKTVIKLAESTGKTISAVAFSVDGEQVAIGFTDNTFAVIRATIFAATGDLELEDGHFDLFDSLGEDQLIHAGIATKDELNDLRAKRHIYESAKIEKRDREIYERLKAKYGHSLDL
jgi:hypothetical protein